MIDSLPNLSPMRSENDAVQVLKALTPLQLLTTRGISTLISQHPKKGPTLPGQAARGSGALSGFVDIIIEMDGLSRRKIDRRRRLRGFSRHADTPANLIIEWTADGTDYISRGTSVEPDFEDGWPVLRGMLEQAEGPLTRRAILRHWPESPVLPGKVTLWKWLDRVVREGKVLQAGRGTRKEPFKYQLPGMIEKWQAKFIEEFTKQLEEGPVNAPKPWL